MSIISQALPLLYLLFVLAVCAFLLMRGVTHLFVAFFACGALLDLIPHLGYIAMTQMAGGVRANTSYFAILQIFSTLGMVCFALGFLLLAKFLLGAGHSSRT